VLFWTFQNIGRETNYVWFVKGCCGGVTFVESFGTICSSPAISRK